jgi:hypothetical protein
MYVIFICPAGDLWATRYEWARIIRRERFRTRCLFFATVISHRLNFRALTGDQLSLMRGVVLATLLAALVFRTRQPMARGLRGLSAVIAAVGLPPVVSLADVEPRHALAAAHLEENEFVHPSRKDENWTATSGASTVRTYWLSIRRLYTRVQAPTWTLLRLVRDSDLQEHPAPREFSS